MGNQYVDVLKRGEFESKIVFLVKGHSTNAQLQYNETWHTDLSVVKINYYGNQSSLWIGEDDTVGDAQTNSI